MAGCWEHHDRTLLLATIHTETTTMAWAYGLANLRIPGQRVGLTGMPYDHARNEACKGCLANGFEWLAFLDSDVVPPSDAFLRLLSHRQPIISGLYCRRSPPHGIPVAIRDGTWVTTYPKGQVIEVDYVGAGCLLIHRSVLERMQAEPGRPASKRWFDWKVDLAGLVPPGEALSEDFAWCRRAKRDYGYRILLDTSIECKHIGFAEAKYGSFGPLECSPVT